LLFFLDQLRRGPPPVLSYAVLIEQIGGAPPTEGCSTGPSCRQLQSAVGLPGRCAWRRDAGLVTTIRRCWLMVYSDGTWPHGQEYVALFTYLALFSSSMLAW